MSPSTTREAPPPSDSALERGILGGLSTYQNYDEAVAAGLTADAFYEPLHAHLFSTGLKLRAAGRPADLGTISRELNGHLTEDARHRILNMVEAGGLRSDIAIQATELARLHTQRRLLEQLDRTRDLVLRDPERVPEALLALQGITVGPATGEPTTWRHIDPEKIRAGSETQIVPTILCRDDGQTLLYPKRVNAIYGEPTGGKTWFALMAAIHQLDAGRNVLFIDFEDRGEGIYERLRFLGLDADVLWDSDRFRYMRVFESIEAPGARAALIAELDELHPSLVIVDGVGESMSVENLNPYDNPDTVTWWGKLPRFLTRHPTEPAVLLIDHVTKDKDKQGGWAIGAQAKVAAIDGASYSITTIPGELGFARNERGSMNITVSKDRNGAVGARGQSAATMILDSHDDIIEASLLHPVRDDTVAGSRGSAVVPTYVMEQVSKWIEDSPGCSKNVIETGIHAKAVTIRESITRLVNARYITTSPGARGSLNHTSLHPYRQNDPLPWRAND